MIARRRFLAAVGGSLVLGASVARDGLAQARPGAARVGLLFAAAPPTVAPRVAALREALAALGYTDGAQIVLEPRYADGDLARLPTLAQELVRLPVSVIVSGGSSATRPALDATRTIPIVMAQDNDPVESGVVKSLARPGGNVTGFATLTPELAAKQLELLAEMVPGLTRVALFGDSQEAGNAATVAEAEAAAARLGIALQVLDARKLGGAPQLFAAALQHRAGAVLVLAGAYLFARHVEVVELAARHRLPAIYAHGEAVTAGGLATYGVNVIELYRRTAGLVVKILNGAKPADIPVEQASKFEFVINMKTAKALGLVLSASVLRRAENS